MSYSIAIDGPAGAGKSTIAKKVAEKKHFQYVDTGAMYRAMALHLLRSGIRAEETEKISEKCREADITVSYKNGEQVVFLNGENVNGLIRSEEVGQMTSASSVNEDVRRKLVGLQRQMAEKENVVMDGRDIGTCVLPDANVKVYLTASSAVRAKRRYDQIKAGGGECDLAAIEKGVKERDERDMNRKISPLCQAEDAVLIDSSSMTIDEVVDAILRLCGTVV